MLTNPFDPLGHDKIKEIKNSFSQHKIAVEDTRTHSEERTAAVVHAEPIDVKVTTMPKKRALMLKERKYKHLTPETKKTIINSVVNQRNYCNTAKIFNVR